MNTTNTSHYSIHITIGTRDYKVNELTMSSTQIKELAVPNVNEYDLYLEVDGPGNTTLIPDDAPAIPLVDDMVFLLQHRQDPTVTIIVNAQEYIAPKHTMTGAEIKQLADIQPHADLYLIPTAREDEQISDSQVVYLIRDEQFVSKEKKEVEIIVNGRPKLVMKDKLSYREVIELAFGQYDPNPNVAYTVTYSKGKHEDKGSLVDGQQVMVQKGMVFNVSRSDKS